MPSSGWLYFFYDRYFGREGYDPDDRGFCRVIYADCDRSTLARTEPPSDADPEHFARPCRVETWLELTIPDDLPEIEYGTPPYEAFWVLRDELIDTDRWQHNRLLGHPQIIQTPMELQCQLASHGVYDSAVQQAELEALSPGAADWRLLLQIDSDEEGPGWMWGDVGRIYFWIKRQDLRTLRFDDAWLILQCT